MDSRARLEALEAALQVAIQASQKKASEEYDIAVENRANASSPSQKKKKAQQVTQQLTKTKQAQQRVTELEQQVLQARQAHEDTATKAHAQTLASKTIAAASEAETTDTEKLNALVAEAQKTLLPETGTLQARRQAFDVLYSQINQPVGIGRKLADCVQRLLLKDKQAVEDARQTMIDIHKQLFREEEAAALAEVEAVIVAIRKMVAAETSAAQGTQIRSLEKGMEAYEQAEQALKAILEKHNRFLNEHSGTEAGKLKATEAKEAQQAAHTQRLIQEQAAALKEIDDAIAAMKLAVQESEDTTLDNRRHAFQETANALNGLLKKHEFLLDDSLTDGQLNKGALKKAEAENAIKEAQGALRKQHLAELDQTIQMMIEGANRAATASESYIATTYAVAQPTDIIDPAQKDLEYQFRIENKRCELMGLRKHNLAELEQQNQYDTEAQEKIKQAQKDIDTLYKQSDEKREAVVRTIIQTATAALEAALKAAEEVDLAQFPEQQKRCADKQTELDHLLSSEQHVSILYRASLRQVKNAANEALEKTPTTLLLRKKYLLSMAINSLVTALRQTGVMPEGMEKKNFETREQDYQARNDALKTYTKQLQELQELQEQYKSDLDANTVIAYTIRKAISEIEVTLSEQVQALFNDEIEAALTRLHQIPAMPNTTSEEREQAVKDQLQAIENIPLRPAFCAHAEDFGKQIKDVIQQTMTTIHQQLRARANQQDLEERATKLQAQCKTIEEAIRAVQTAVQGLQQSGQEITDPAERLKLAEAQRGKIIQHRTTCSELHNNTGHVIGGLTATQAALQEEVKKHEETVATLQTTTANLESKAAQANADAQTKTTEVTRLEQECRQIQALSNKQQAAPQPSQRKPSRLARFIARHASGFTVSGIVGIGFGVALVVLMAAFPPTGLTAAAILGGLITGAALIGLGLGVAITARYISKKVSQYRKSEQHNAAAPKQTTLTNAQAQLTLTNARTALQTATNAAETANQAVKAAARNLQAAESMLAQAQHNLAAQTHLLTQAQQDKTQLEKNQAELLQLEDEINKIVRQEQTLIRTHEPAQPQPHQAAVMGSPATMFAFVRPSPTGTASEEKAGNDRQPLLPSQHEASTGTDSRSHSPSTAPCSLS
jgi:hypothetical protein